MFWLAHCRHCTEAREGEREGGREGGKEGGEHYIYDSEKIIL